MSEFQFRLFPRPLLLLFLLILLIPHPLHPLLLHPDLDLLHRKVSLILPGLRPLHDVEHVPVCGAVVLLHVLHNEVGAVVLCLHLPSEQLDLKTRVVNTSLAE